MKKEFDLKKHIVILVSLVIIVFVLDFLTPGLDFFGFKFGRVATASLVVDYGRGGIREFAGEVVKEMTVFDALMASSSAGLKVDYAHNGPDLTFLSIDGRGGVVKVKVNDQNIPVEKLNQRVVTQGDLIKVELP